MLYWSPPAPSEFAAAESLFRREYAFDVKGAWKGNRSGCLAVALFCTGVVLPMLAAAHCVAEVLRTLGARIFASCKSADSLNNGEILHCSL